MSKLIKYVGPEWYHLLKPAFDKNWESIQKTIKTEKRNISPKLSQVFRCFQECPLRDLHTIIIAEGPYTSTINNIPTADGLALSVNPDIKGAIPYQAKHLYQATECQSNLTYVANQGVLLLNTALTCAGGVPGSHDSIWQAFIDDAFELILKYDTGFNVVAIGNKAETLLEIHDLDNHVVFLNPDFDVEDWEEDFVDNVNNNLLKCNLTPILW